jgi:P-type E1-E2 ATPase
VFRGRDEFTQSVIVSELVVGDVVLLKAGQRVPADCLVIDSYNLSVNEYKISGLDSPMRKEKYTQENYENNPDPFLYSQSIILSG